MARKQYFDYAVLYHPKAREIDGVKTVPDSIVLIEPTRLLASNEAEVQVLVGRQIPNNYLDKLEDVEVLIRPF